ncbi:hypothetical protein FF1_006165 [Malus domestica]
MRPHILPTFSTKYAKSCWLKSMRRSWNMDLLRGGRVRDFSGVKSHCILGVKDSLGILDRRRLINCLVKTETIRNSGTSILGE